MWRAVFDGDADKRCSSDLKAAGRELVGTRVGRRGKERRRRREKRKRTGLCNSFPSRRLCESEVLDPHVRVQIRWRCQVGQS
jgi:hypothetical protein